MKYANNRVKLKFSAKIYKEYITLLSVILVMLDYRI